MGDNIIWDTDRRVRRGLYFCLSALIICLIASGCSTILMPAAGAQSSHRCASHLEPESSHARAAPALPPRNSDAPTNGADFFSVQVVSFAEVIGARPLLDELAELSESKTGRTIEFLELRQELTDRVLLGAFEVSSEMAEVICERDRADQAARRIDDVDSSRVKSLTLASIVLGGVAAIVSGGIGLAGGATTGSDIAEVTGGVLSAAFGGTALFTGSRQEFKHEHNVLKEVWDDPPNSSLFSHAIWKFLHRRHKQGEKTPREELIAAWRQEGMLGKPGSKTEEKRMALFFGPGGNYDARELRARASMLEELEATIQLMNQELEVFVREVSIKLQQARKAQ